MIKRTSSMKRLLKGGEMMKTLILTLALVIVVAGAAMAITQTATIDIYAGDNQLGCTLAPANLATDTNPELDFTEPFYAMEELGDNLFTLIRWDAANASLKTYGSDMDFGKLLLGDGYMVNAASATQIHYTGLENGIPYTDPVTSVKTKTDMWISLPGFKGDLNTAPPSGGGWHLIATPYANNVPVFAIDGENVVWKVNFTDGNVVLDWLSAVNESWVSDTLVGYENGNQVLVTLSDENSLTLKAGRSYWFQTSKDDIAMIISAN